MRKGRPVGSRRFWFESDYRFIQLFGPSNGLPVGLGRGNDGEAANSVTSDVYYSHQQPIEVGMEMLEVGLGVHDVKDGVAVGALYSIIFRSYLVCQL